jgi:hypothetical protein
LAQSNQYTQNSVTWQERFWTHVNKTDTCWLWTGGITGNYGALWTGLRNEGAHRCSWIIHNGPVPSGMYVLHHCDNGLCIRPDHLFLGTAQDNMDDKTNKARNNVARGSTHYKTKLTNNDIIHIRRKYSLCNTKQVDLAEELGLSRSAIEKIVNNRTWKHVEV